MATLVQLQTFLWLSRLGSASAVAEHLNLTQPAVSSRLAQLQDQMQVQLFARTRDGLQLTSAGHRLKAHAEQIEARMALLRDDLMPRDARARVLRLGVAETIANSWLADFLLAVAAERPEVHLDLSIDITDNLRGAVTSRGVDMAILMGPLSSSEVTNHAVPEIPMAWFRPMGWDAARAARAPIVTFATTTKPFRQMWARVLRGEEDRRFIPTTSLSSGFELVARGVGVGALPQVYSDRLMAAQRVETYEGGPLPEPPRFTVSYLAEPLDSVLDAVAALALETARGFDRNAPR